MQRLWEECKQDGTRGRWAGFHVTMTPRGEIAINCYALEALGEQERFVLLFDRLGQTIGLKPAHSSTENAVKAFKHGRHGGRIIRAYRLCQEFNIHLNETIRFLSPAIDSDGIMLLDLRNAKTAARRRKKAESRES